MRVLVTRPEPAASILCAQIEKQGQEAICFPTISFRTRRNCTILNQTLQQLNEQEWLIFTSPRAVSGLIEVMHHNGQIVLPNTLKLAAVGETTAKALREAGLVVTLCPHDEWRSEALLALLPFQHVRGKKIAVVRGAGGREYLDHTLRERGSELLPVIVYERVLPEMKENDPLYTMLDHTIDVTVSTSYEGINNLKQLLSRVKRGNALWESLQKKSLIVVSERIKNLAHDVGFAKIKLARNASNTAILEVLSDSL